jgi:hypothetical protein
MYSGHSLKGIHLGKLMLLPFYDFISRPFLKFNQHPIDQILGLLNYDPDISLAKE